MDDWGRSNRAWRIRREDRVALREWWIAGAARRRARLARQFAEKAAPSRWVKAAEPAWWLVHFAAGPEELVRRGFEAEAETGRRDWRAWGLVVAGSAGLDFVGLDSVGPEFGQV